MSESESLRSQFWEQGPWGDALRVVRLDTLVIPTRGRSGQWVLDEVELGVREKRDRGLVAYAPRLQPGGVAALSQRLTRALRESVPNRFEGREPVTLVVVEVATSALIDACRRERLGVMDLAGTVDLETSTMVLQIAGRRRVARPVRVSPTSALGGRVIRTLLLTLDDPPQTKQLAERLHASYSSVWSALAGLEKLGLVARAHGRAPRVLDPRALLRHWCEQGAPPLREGWFCPSTSTEALASGLARLRKRGADALFTYRSALAEDELFVTGLPHGVRSAAASELLVDAFGLRPVTPQNFFVLRDLDSAFGGPSTGARQLKAGPSVSVPQLVFDLHHAGSRAAEQAAALVDRWWASLPPRRLDD